MKQKLGDDCSWSVGWYDPNGKRKQKNIGSKSKAETFARKTEGQLAAGIYEDRSRMKWSEFMDEQRVKAMAGMEPGTREVTSHAVAHFERIIKPVKLASSNGRTFAEYVAVRRKESSAGPARKPKPTDKLVSTILAHTPSYAANSSS